eukprot:CAMPEP_0117010558 /NCGR_PEP_ID=MMETSP0472-20121206/9274_1 /TAXON_ID=693140 ORGANISM="Tiarina fusus, Strain LIS" /NCGR_SAMPLE_ID=MMETSP0472 /ASSEMBLY_ACC=CAM_ASM_000603 /LENGTH=335 /DNA_ID=CAMNT_0004713119 /DNA_START=50 /DNA_END=1057 /DNA_ORIENTATION=+
MAAAAVKAKAQWGRSLWASLFAGSKPASESRAGVPVQGRRERKDIPRLEPFALLRLHVLENSQSAAGILFGQNRRWLRAAPVQDILRLSFGFCMIPHPMKAKKGGEDACFVGFNCAGVADGVGGWASQGVDAGQYSRMLLKHAKTALLERENPEMRAVVATAAERTQVKGSATVCLLFLKGEICYAINLGDSGFLLLRSDEQGPRVVVRSKPQQHDFNTPYQLGCNLDTAADAEEYFFKVRRGDVVVLATDGLFDNVYDEDIAREAFARDEPQARADHLARFAHNTARMQNSRTPFAEAYSQLSGTLMTGGKMDDVSVIVANVLSLDIDEVPMTG